MQEHSYFIQLQENNHPRELVYELSVLYLVARSIHLAVDINIVKYVQSNGITVDELNKHYQEYEEDGLKILIETLCYLNIFSYKDNKYYSTPYSQTLLEYANTLTVSKEAWLASFEILDYLNDPVNAQNINNNGAKIEIIGNSLTYYADSPEAILQGIAHGHLLSRTMRFLAEAGFFTLMGTVKQPIGYQDLIDLLTKQSPLYPWQEKSSGLLSMLTLLSRYHFIMNDPEHKTIQLLPLSFYLIKDTPETLYPTMLMIDKKWWGATAYMAESFKKASCSAFEFINHQHFYHVVQENPKLFAEGMAAISLFEDKDVAEKSREAIAKFNTVIDIGGGEGGLLAMFYRYYGEEKHYILFEKQPKDENDRPRMLEAMKQRIKAQWGAVNIQIVLGDFFLDKEHNQIPRYAHSAYFIKCVLHNMQEPEVIKALSHVYEAMGDNSEFFLAERIDPIKTQRITMNHMSNMLMRVLFKARNHDMEFYKRILTQEGFECVSVNQAGNYGVFHTIKRPQLQHKAEADRIPQNAATPFWAQRQPSPVIEQSLLVDQAEKTSAESQYDPHAYNQRSFKK